MKTTKDGQSEYLVRYAQDCWKEADDASKDRREVWKELWSCFQNRQDTSKKLPWQSKMSFPKIWMQVERSSGEVRRALLETQKLFKLRVDDSGERGRLSQLQVFVALTADPNLAGEAKRAIDALGKNLRAQDVQRGVDEARFRSDLAKTNLAAVYSEMSKVAFLLGLGIPKVGWSRRRNRVVFENVDPFNIRIAPDWSPTGEDTPEYILERKEVRLTRLRKMAQDANKYGKEQIYDLSALDQVTEDYKSQERTEEDERRGISDHLRKSGRVECWWLWGDIPKEDSTGYDKTNRCIVILNRQHIFRNGPNPYEHGRPPYVPTMPLVYPFRGSCGSSLVEPVVPMQYMLSNIWNMFVDGLNFTVNKQFQMDPGQLLDPRQQTSIYPGKIWRVKSGMNSAPVIREVPMGQMGMDALKAMEVLNNAMQEATGVTEFLQGLPGSQTKTLGEIEIKTMESRGMFDIIAKEMEQYSLQPLLEMTYDLYAQFGEPKYPKRDDKYHISVGGVSLLLAQKQLLESIAMVLGLALKHQPLAQQTDISDLWQKMLSVHNLSDSYVQPQEALTGELSPEQVQAYRQKAEQDAKQLVAQMPPEEIQQYAQGGGQ